MIPRPCIDRILPTDIFRLQRTTTELGRLRAVAPIGKTWITGSTLDVLFLDGKSSQRAVVVEQASWWSQACNIKFNYNNPVKADIRISFNPDGGAWSYPGTDAKHIPLDQPTMNLGFLDGGTAAHEFGHALGLGHEHSNPAGGIMWNENQVIEDLSGPPNFWTPEMIRHNVFHKYSADQINGTEFDPHSIMLYWFPKEWTLNGVETKANEVLSTLDKSFITGARMYPMKDLSDIPELKVNGNRQGAIIGKFGEEDLFWFEAIKADRYIIDTIGPTDVVMKLFGPSSQTALIADDDDSGIGLNARITRELIPGEYFVQVRHWNRHRGTGAYSINVRLG